MQGGLVLAGVGLLAGCRMLPLQVAPQARVVLIGFLSPTNGPASREFEAFRQGMRDLDYIEGRNLAIEHRLTDAKNERMPALAAELVSLTVDVIVTDGLAAAAAARDATQTIPNV